jgi:hypothetical protein
VAKPAGQPPRAARPRTEAPKAPAAAAPATPAAQAAAAVPEAPAEQAEAPVEVAPVVTVAGGHSGLADAVQQAERLVVAGGAAAVVEAAGLLQQSGRDEAALGLYLGRWAADRRPALRLLALEAAGLLHQSGRRALLGLLLDDPRRDLRRRAARDFVRSADLRRSADRERVAELMRGSDELIQASVAEEVVAWVAHWDGAGEKSGGFKVRRVAKDPELRALLDPLLASPSARARAAVVRGLGAWRLGSPLSLPEVAEWAQRGVEDPSAAVRRPAAAVLAAVARSAPDTGWPLVRRLYQRGDARTRSLLERECVAGAFGDGGITRDEAWIWATEPDQRTRRALAVALSAATRGRGWERDLLRHLTVDPVASVRGAALGAATRYAGEAWAQRVARREVESSSPAVAKAAAQLVKAWRKGA